MKKALSIFLFSLTAAAFGVTASTPIFGVFKGEIPANSEAYIGITATRAPVFTGVVGSVDTSLAKVTAKGEKALWTANQFKFADGAQPEHYYLKITSGELEGAWYDIIANDDFSVTIEIGDAEIAKLAAEKDTTFQIIPHWTMATLFPNGGGFAPSINRFSPLTKAAQVFKFTAYGEDPSCRVGENITAMKKFIYLQSSNKWVFYPNTSDDAGSCVVEPNSVLLALQSAGSTSTYSYTGEISMCATSIEFYTLTDDNGTVKTQDIYIPVPASVDISLRELTTALIDSEIFTPVTNRFGAGVDMMYVYDNEKQMQNSTPTATFHYRKVAGTTIDEWQDKSNKKVEDYTLKAGTCLLIRKKATASE